MTAWYRAGTVEATNGSATVTGTLTAFLMNVKVGDLWAPDADGRGYEVTAVNSNTEIEIAPDYAGSTGSSKAYGIARISPNWNSVSELSVSLADILATNQSIITGTGVPDNSLGQDGDIYFRLDEPEYYIKESGSWTLEADLVGPQGPAGPSYQATSTSSVTIGTGPKSFTVETGRGYSAGQWLRAAYDDSNYVEGPVVSYDSGTGALIINVPTGRAIGSGTYTAWNVNITGDPGPANSLAIGSVTTGAAGSNASANITGTPPSQTLDLVIPRGNTGATGATGPQGTAGTPGAAATIAVGTTTTLTPGTSATVANSGTSSAAVFDFGIPAGRGYGGSSTTSLAIAVAQKTFTTQAGLAYVTGSRVRASSAADSNNWMEGRCSSYSGTSLVIEIDLIGAIATGTHADWVFSIVGERGVPGAGSLDTVNGNPGPNVVLVAADIGYATTPTNYTPASGNVAGHLQGIDTKLAAGGSPSAPQGRLTLQTATPVMSTSQTAKTTIYYAPYLGTFVPLYDGTKFVMTDIGGELSQALSDTTKSPAAAANNSNYDLFVWDDSGTMRVSRGPAWSSDTARGTGAGTTELERVAGLLTNKVAITNGPAANRGTYVGTIRTNGSAAVDWSLGGLADQGTPGNFGLWNCYNRRRVVAQSRMSANSWTYNSTTPRAPNGSTNMRTSFIVGLQEDDVVGCYGSPMLVGSSGGSLTNVGRVGVGFDTTTAMTGVIVPVASPETAATGGMGFGSAKPGIGWHFMSAIEMCGTVSDSVTFYGDANAATVFQNSLEVDWWA